jgi:hypothetical protein
VLRSTDKTRPALALGVTLSRLILAISLAAHWDKTWRFPVSTFGQHVNSPPGVQKLSGAYSVRSALIGGIAAARPAGMTATNAHTASDPAAIVRAKGPQNETP